MLNKQSHKVYKLLYHLILVTKYRKKIFTIDNIITDIKDKLVQISGDFDVIIIEANIDQDHVHLLIETKPTIELTKYLNILKGHSSRYIRKKYKQFLNDKLYGDSFWSDSYYIATTGNVSLSNLIDYLNKKEDVTT